MLHSIVEIFSVKASDDNVLILQFQNSCNVVFDHFCGGCGESTEDRMSRQLPHEIYDFQVAGTEILSPLGDTVCLVYCHHGNGSMQGKRQKRSRFQPLRCHINNLVHASCGERKCLADLSFCKGRIDICRMDSRFI